MNGRGASDSLAGHAQSSDLAPIGVFLAAWQCFKVLRQCADRVPRQRVVPMSSYTRKPVRQRALDAGADAFFDKTEPEGSIDFCIRPSSVTAGSRPETRPTKAIGE